MGVRNEGLRCSVVMTGSCDEQAERTRQNQAIKLEKPSGLTSILVTSVDWCFMLALHPVP